MQARSREMQLFTARKRHIDYDLQRSNNNYVYPLQFTRTNRYNMLFYYELIFVQFCTILTGYKLISYLIRD